MRWVEISANPLFCQRRESKAFSGAVSVKVPGHRQSWGEGWVWGFLFLFLFQSFYQRYIQVTHTSSEAFSPKISIFTQGIHLKKSLEKPKLNLFFPSSSLSSELKKINYMLILSHRSEKPHRALMELTLFLNFQLCTRSSISVTPACVSSHQEHLHHHSKEKLPPILSCIHQH